MAASQIIWTEEIGNVLIPLAGDNNIKLHNVALISRCNSNLISLGQFCKSRIIYHDNLKAMILIRNKEVIAQAKKDWNLFIFDFAQPGKAITIVRKKIMAIIGRGQPTHLVSQKKHIWLWHCQLVHVNNAYVVRISKLVDGIDLNMDKKYDLAEVLVDSNNSNSDTL